MLTTLWSSPTVCKEVHHGGVASSPPQVTQTPVMTLTIGTGVTCVVGWCYSVFWKLESLGTKWIKQQVSSVSTPHLIPWLWPNSEPRGVAMWLRASFGLLRRLRRTCQSESVWLKAEEKNQLLLLLHCMKLELMPETGKKPAGGCCKDLSSHFFDDFITELETNSSEKGACNERGTERIALSIRKKGCCFQQTTLRVIWQASDLS